MKIIISEEQYRLLAESKNLGAAQNLIDQAFDELKESCEKNWVEQYACDQMEAVEEVRVVASDKASTITRDQKTNFWLIEVDIYYLSLMGYTPFEDFIYQLQFEARQIVGSRNVVITIRGTINSNKDSNW